MLFESNGHVLSTGVVKGHTGRDETLTPVSADFGVPEAVEKHLPCPSETPFRSDC
jgi:hypothetical protein